MKIMNTKDVATGAIKLVIAGEAGNGKTTLAATLQDTLGEKVIVISAEAGLLSIRNKNVDYLELQNKWNGKIHEPVGKTERVKYLYEILAYLNTPEMKAKYQWIFIDSLSEIQQNMLESLDANPEFSGPKNMIKKYGELSSRMMSLCKAFRDIPHYNVVFSALVKSDTNADNQVTTKIGLMGAFAEKLPALFDEIFYLGVTKELAADGRHVRQILTQKTDKIDFPKDRSGRLSRVEPADLGAIVQKIRSVPAVKAPVASVKQQPQLGV